MESSREDLGLVLEINSKTNSNLIQSSTICFDSWGKRKRRPRGTKPLNQFEETGSDLAGFGAGNGARVSGSAAAAVRRKETTLTGGPHLSAPGRERGAGGSGLGRRGPHAGEREKGGVGPESAQGPRRGNF